MKAFGAKGDGKTDDTDAIKSAISSLQSTGGTIFIPKGVYVLGTPSPGEGGYLDNYFLKLVSNLTIEGEGKASVLKLRDHFLDGKDDNSANAHFMWGKGLKNVTIRNLTFDGNGANNSTPAGHIRNSMFILLDGDGMTVRKNLFINCAGHNMVATAGKKAVIEDNVLKNGGHYVGAERENKYNADFSFMYIASNDARISGNIIEQEMPDIAMRGYTGGIEIHGDNALVTDNRITGCNPGMYVVNDTNRYGVMILRNTLEKCLRGIVIWNTQLSMKQVTIAENDIRLYRPPFRKWDAVYGIGQENGGVPSFSDATANGGPVEDLLIKGNHIVSASPPDTPAIQGIRLHSVKRGTIVGNIIEGLSDIGIVLSGSPWGISSLHISDNRIFDCGSAQPNLPSRAAIHIQTSGRATTPLKQYFIKDVFIEKNEFGNTYRDIRDKYGITTGSVCKGNLLTGIALIGYDRWSQVENLLIRGNSYSNLIWKLWGPEDPLHPEKTNPGIRLEPETVYAKTKPVSDRRMFGSEIVRFPDGSRYRCVKGGYFSTRSGRITGAAGSDAVLCDGSTGLHVGMELIIDGAGKLGEDLHAAIRDIDNQKLLLTEKIGKGGGIVNARYSISQPTLTPF